MWDQAEDNSPLGNDTGADVQEFFEEWRESSPRKSPLAFLRQLLRRWQVVETPWLANEDGLVERLNDHHYHLLTYDDSVIGLAFAQLAREGVVEEQLRSLALAAVKRQALPGLIAFRGWTDPAERAEHLAEMERVLTAARGAA